MAQTRLTYVHTAEVPSSAANAVQVAKMCEAFVAEGVDTELVTWGAIETSNVFDQAAAIYDLKHRFRIRRLSPSRLPGRQLLFGARAAVLAHARRSIIFTRSISVASMATRMGVDTVLELHDFIDGWRPVQVRRLSALIRSPRLILVVLISRRLANAFADRWPEIASRALVAHDAASPAEKQKTHPWFSNSPDTRLKVGYTGGLYPGKGMEILAAVAPLRPDAVFHVVGGVSPWLEEWRGRLADMENVIFHGYVSHSEVQQFIASFDVVLAPYLREVRGVGGGVSNLAEWMSPLKLFEYMAQAKAIVSSDLPVLREVITDGVDALLVSPEDIAGWAAAIKRLGADPMLRRELGDNAHRRFTTHYTWSARADGIITELRGSADPLLK